MKKLWRATFEKIRFEVSYLPNDGKKLEQITKFVADIFSFPDTPVNRSGIYLNQTFRKCTKGKTNQKMGILGMNKHTKNNN